MSEISRAENYLIEQIRQGQSQAWTQLVDRYQGRLLAFAQGRLPQRADAEDIVQETFIGFLKGLENFRQQASVETYLFTILRRKIIDLYRSRAARDVCLIQDVYKNTDRQENSDAYNNLPAPDPTASWYVRRDEQYDLQQKALQAALRDLVNGYKKNLNFRDMQIIELLFYCHIPNKNIAKVVDISEKNIAVIKHRCLKQIRIAISRFDLLVDPTTMEFENMLTDIWESQRLSCPKRSTIGAFYLKTLDDQWLQYVDFHLNTMGCHFCRASLEDLKRQDSASQATQFKARIMESTVGFLHKT